MRTTLSLAVLLSIAACGPESPPSQSNQALSIELGPLRQSGWVAVADPDKELRGHRVLLQAERHLLGEQGAPTGLGARLRAFRFNTPQVDLQGGAAVLAALTSGMVSWRDVRQGDEPPVAIHGVEGVAGAMLHCDGRSRDLAGTERESRVSMLVVSVDGGTYGVRVEMWRSDVENDGLLLEADYLLSAGVVLRH